MSVTPAGLIDALALAVHIQREYAADELGRQDAATRARQQGWSEERIARVNARTREAARTLVVLAEAAIAALTETKETEA